MTNPDVPNFPQSDAIAVVRSTDPRFTTEFVIPVEEARAHTASGYLAQHAYSAAEYVSADALERAARRAFLRWNERALAVGSRDPEGEFMDMLGEELPLRDPAPGQTFEQWGCAADV